VSKSLFSLLAAALLLLSPIAVTAGMPAPLPTNTRTVQRLNDSALMRLQTISFFLAGILLCAAVVRGLWNWLQRDFPQLPRLSFGKALAGVLLWGLLFVIVLTMISGARELMTPGAWRKQGFTYKLTNPAEPASESSPQTVRRQHLEKLRTALWQFAATHNGQFPDAAKQTAISRQLWEVPETGGLRYLYLPGLSASHVPALLVYEPELDSEERFVLWTNGDVSTLRSSEIRSALKQESRP
jgi:hypothetical protein